MPQTGRVVAIDPGLVTGICAVDMVLGDDGNRRLVVAASAETDFLRTGRMLQTLLLESDPETTGIVMERFTITAKTAKNSQAPWSLEVIGMCRWIADEQFGGRFGEIVMQGPAEAKRMIPNELLRAAEVWHVGGAGHANDALRHAVYRFVRTHQYAELWQS
jgi:hypothetical protein